jgi:RHS repeat-associated protein
MYRSEYERAADRPGRTFARKVACLLAVLLCSFFLATQARAQACDEWWWGSNGAVCLNADPDQVMSCAAAAMNPQYYSEGTLGNCGIAGDPNLGCVGVYGYEGHPGSDGVWGTIEMEATPVATCPKYYASALPTPSNQVCSSDCVGDPINPALGNMYTEETDVRFSGAGAIEFQRFYNSGAAGGTPGWRTTYSRSVSILYEPPPGSYPGQSATISPEYPTPGEACVSGFSQVQGAVSAWAGATAAYDGTQCAITNSAGVIISTLAIYTAQNSSTLPTLGAVEYDVVRDDGQVLRYFPTLNDTINNPPGISIQLAVTSSGFTVTDDDNNVEIYNSEGVLQSITSRTGVVQTMSYTGGVWSGVTDSFGNSLTASRNTNGTLASVTVGGGGTVQYSYDSSQRLSTVTNLDGTTRSYVYGDSSFPEALTAEVDESGTTFSTWAYDSDGRATSDTLAVGANAMSLVYNGDGSVTTTDALGAVRTFTYTRIGDMNKNTSISGSQCPTCQDSAATTSDSYGWVASRTDYNGNVTCYAHDPTRGLELVRVEGFVPGNACPANLSSYTPASGTLQRMITTQWSTTWREPVLITEPNRTIAFTYDSHGNVLTQTVTDTTVSPNVSRTWTYTYNGYGQLLTARGPRTDVNSTTTYTYYSCTSGTQCGQVQTVTDALGHLWTYNTYNAYGQPLTVTDPNGVLMTLAYDARQRLISKTIAGETTTLSYYPTGLLETITLPDQSNLTFTYDGAHRLTQFSDGSGNKIVYTLDAMGNRTAENTYDPSGTLDRTHSRVINTLNEVYQEINAAGTPAVTTTYAYDNNGNQTAINAPLSRNTANVYDALNRLTQITNPANGVIGFSYDANDNLTSVTDPRSLLTSYTNDGFGEMVSRLSPDTGATANTYDAAGNLSTSTDARGAISTYTYDALNRVTAIAYSLGGTADQTIALTYDSGTNGIGRLAGASDANHSLSWSYDALGRVISRSQTVVGVTRTVGYGYTAGDLTSVTTPSGQTVTYGYNGNHQITSIAVNGSTLLNGVTYEPFGAVSGWNWGNGTTVVRTYDEDGNATSVATGGETDSYAYDVAMRLTSDTNVTNSNFSWTYGYDGLDRLTSESGVPLQETYTYDANGNLLTTAGTFSATETVSPSSNQIVQDSIDGTLTYDAAGNTTGIQQVAGTASYNDAGRGVSVTANLGWGSMTVQFLYDAFGQRIHKASPLGNTLFVYDDSKHLLGEYDDSGNLIEEMVWLGDTPVATLRPDGGGGIAIYYVHTDHLNTPRQITRPSDNLLVWRNESDAFETPFGELPFNENPSGLGTFVSNLGFPGQYYDLETNLYYNGARYYANFGRYLQSDPIGLAGGINTYAYADGNPVSEDDPTGLAAFGGLGGNVSPAEAQALSIMQAFKNWWNTPDPCMKKKLTDRYGNRLTKGIGFMSLASLVPGPWNLSDAADTLVEDTTATPAKVAGDKGATSAAESLGFSRTAAGISVGGEAFGAAASLASIAATIANIQAYASSSDCGCGK